MNPKSPHIELFQLLMWMLFMYFASQLLFGVVLSMFTSIEFLNEHMNDPRIFLSGAVMLQVMAFVLPPLIIVRSSQKPYTDFIGIGKMTAKWIGITIVVFILSYFVMQILSVINGRLEDIIPNSSLIQAEKEGDELMNALVSNPSYIQFIFSLVIIGILTPICEELFFRGFLLGAFLKISQGNKHFAVFTSSLIFAGLHLQPLKLLPMLFLGMCLGYLYVESKNLKYSILFHSLINSSQIILAFILSSEA
jgi:sodium transport system permease protein